MVLSSIWLWGAGQRAGKVAQLRGSVVLLGLPVSMASAAFTLLLHALWRKELAQRLSGVYLFHLFAVILGLMIVFRCAPYTITKPTHPAEALIHRVKE